MSCIRVKKKKSIQLQETEVIKVLVSILQKKIEQFTLNKIKVKHFI